MRQDSSPQAMQQRQLESRFNTVILFAVCVLCILLALAVFALATTGPITTLSKVVGVCSFVGAIATAWAGWNRRT